MTVTIRRRTRTASATLLTAALVLVLTGCSAVLPDSYRYGTVDVLVTDTAGAPVPGAGLLLYIGVRQMAVGTTDGRGRHRFAFVPANDYGIYLSSTPPGYRLPAGDIGHRYIHMDEGTTGSVSFELLPTGGGQ